MKMRSAIVFFCTFLSQVLADTKTYEAEDNLDHQHYTMKWTVQSHGEDVTEFNVVSLVIGTDTFTAIGKNSNLRAFSMINSSDVELVVKLLTHKQTSMVRIEWAVQAQIPDFLVTGHRTDTIPVSNTPTPLPAQGHKHGSLTLVTPSRRPVQLSPVGSTRLATTDYTGPPMVPAPEEEVIGDRTLEKTMAVELSGLTVYVTLELHVVPIGHISSFIVKSVDVIDSEDQFRSFNVDKKDEVFEIVGSVKASDPQNKVHIDITIVGSLMVVTADEPYKVSGQRIEIKLDQPQDSPSLF